MIDARHHVVRAAGVAGVAVSEGADDGQTLGHLGHLGQECVPNCTPGNAVSMAPTTLRNSAGASIFGSKVSMCVGPPPSQIQTTEVSLTRLSRAGRAGPLAQQPGQSQARHA